MQSVVRRYRKQVDVAFSDRLQEPVRHLELAGRSFDGDFPKRSDAQKFWRVAQQYLVMRLRDAPVVSQVPQQNVSVEQISATGHLMYSSHSGPSSSKSGAIQILPFIAPRSF